MRNLAIRWILIGGLVGILSTSGWTQNVTLRVGLEAGGTFTWVVRVMERLGLDRQAGVVVQARPFATKTAAETALRAGEIDLKVDDWIYPTRARQQGIRVQAVDAYSRAVGGIVVRRDSPVRGLEDLRGKRIGVPSLADKSYLVLRAVGVAQLGFDPQTASQVIPAAPPLLMQLLERGDLDAAVQYWQFVAQAVGAGRARELVSTLSLIRRIQPGVDVPFLLVVATDEAVRQRPEALRAFLAALRRAQGALAVRRDLWEALQAEGTIGIPDPRLLPNLMARYRLGLPGPWDPRTVAALQALTRRLVEVAGGEVVGVGSLDPAAFNTSLSGPR
jgi:NitT/TauT family transport system substrate-binding protein